VQKYFLYYNSLQFFKLTRKTTLETLKNGFPLGIFPAGEELTVPLYNNKTEDSPWNPETIHLIKAAKVPIVPAFFHAKSSLIKNFTQANYWLLPGENPSPVDLKNRTITLRIGSPISVDEQQEFQSIDKFGRFLRSKVHCLGSAVEIRKFYLPVLKREPKAQAIVEAIQANELNREVQKLKEKHLLFQNKNYSIVCCPTREMPLTMHEIGRLREITFRSVGEGTNREMDIDEFDLYYHQLFIWDDENKALVGAYRLGKGKEIIQNYGLKGFYIQSLFRIEPKAAQIMSQSLELGRSFITQPYQKQPLSLFLLWKGILYFLLKNPEYRFLIGPVSISNQYSTISKSLIIKFISNHFFNHEMAKMFKPRNAFKPNANYDIEILLENTQRNLNKLDSIIADIEFDNYKVPVLLKKYLKLNAEIVGFNIDPLFNNALDGLIFLDLLNVPYNTIESLSKELNDEAILKRFNKEHTLQATII
jgi:putative hemolysin